MPRRHSSSDHFPPARREYDLGDDLVRETHAVDLLKTLILVVSHQDHPVVVANLAEYYQQGIHGAGLEGNVIALDVLHVYLLPKRWRFFVPNRNSMDLIFYTNHTKKLSYKWIQVLNCECLYNLF